MADDAIQTTDADVKEEPKPTPPWGSDEDFNPDKAWTLIQNLRSEAATMKAASKELREKVDALPGSGTRSASGKRTAVGHAGHTIHRHCEPMPRGPLCQKAPQALNTSTAKLFSETTQRSENPQTHTAQSPDDYRCRPAARLPDLPECW